MMCQALEAAPEARADMRPTIIAKTIAPPIISTMAKIRSNSVRATMSPYPTVVSVANVKYKPAT